MTIEEMNNKIQEYCDNATCLDDSKCPIYDICECIKGEFGNTYPEETEKAYEILYGSTEDNVNHPKHYCRDGGMECIDEMLLIFGKSPVMSYCLLNAWKYRYRASDKNGEEDLRKSDWYIRKYKELKEEDENW